MRSSSAPALRFISLPPSNIYLLRFRTLHLAGRNDEELSKLLGTVTIANGGVNHLMPNIHSPLSKKSAASRTGDDEWQLNKGLIAIKYL
ncbi:putative histone H2A.2 [Apostasia shenzhenica]|uniref:Putative histone H2A.2 n=1 Tax=Apostasia shenzhenica TaxID=1088818 RepID=A0A2I0ANW3_9ASPA|nr:putative histone H2A.2 [Apostasia shenzhenica]